MIFLDAGPLIAFLNKRDTLHADADRALRRLFNEGQSLVTTNRVVSEVYDAIRYDRRLSPKNNARPALAVYDAVAAAGHFISVRFVTEEVERQALAILRAYPDQNFSSCDACSFAAIEAAEIHEVFTYDLRDFQTYSFKRRVSLFRERS